MNPEDKRKPISILTPDINLLGVISNYESNMFTLAWHGIGPLELRINRHKQYTNTLQKGNIIVVGGDTRKAYMIVHRGVELNEQGRISEDWHIIAHQLKSVVGRRITMPPVHTSHDNKSGAAESVIKHYIDRNVVNPVDGRRKIPNLVIAPDLQRGMHIDWQSRFKNLAEETADISLLSGLGWDVYVDTKTRKWVFEVYEGRNISVNQDVHDPVVFSPQFGNIKDMQFVDSDLNYRNVAIVAGQGEGVDRRVIEVGQAVGLDRYETFVDARDIAEETDDEEPVQRPIGDIERDLRNRGNQSLAEMSQEVYLEGQILTGGPFKYETDWNLGDIPTLQNKDWGVTLDSRITEVTEVYERDGVQLSAVFGQSRPTLISKIKQELSGMKNEIVR